MYLPHQRSRSTFSIQVDNFLDFCDRMFNVVQRQPCLLVKWCGDAQSTRFGERRPEACERELEETQLYVQTTKLLWGMLDAVDEIHEEAHALDGVD